MYHPFFRGKQYELITIRENAELFSNARFTPIIEPVKESLSGLIRALEAINDAGANAVLIVNPHHGDHVDSTVAIGQLLIDQLQEHQNLSAGMFLSDALTVDDVLDVCRLHVGRDISLIHAGFSHAADLATALARLENLSVTHIFVEQFCGKLYQRHFRGSRKILLRDGFKKRTNREHPPLEFFSDLHITYGDEGVDGFGDYLIVGDEFSETGGPAYAVAIHITYIDPEQDDAMYIHHFISDRTDTPTDPAGKFAEALLKLVTEVERVGSSIFRTEAIEEFIDLHRRGHFPGLGYVKKLSMKHHIETLARYFARG